MQRQDCRQWEPQKLCCTGKLVFTRRCCIRGSSIKCGARLDHCIFSYRALQHSKYLKPYSINTSGRACTVHPRARSNMTTPTAKRVILQFDGIHEYDWQLISRTFRRDHASEASDDFYEQLIPRQQEDKPEQHIVLDLHCRANPSANVMQIPHDAFKAFRSSEADELYVPNDRCDCRHKANL